MNSALLDSPVGPLHVVVENGQLTALYTAKHQRYATVEPPRDGTFAAIREQLDEYFAGTRHAFELPLAPKGTAFERAVWQRLTQIPFGETTTYGEIARELGSVPRAVGRANGRNPISIIVPCHRVIGKDGSLTGYAGGLETKRVLLEHEGVFAGRLSEPPGVAF